VSKDQTTTKPEARALLPPVTGSETCYMCKWTNVSLLNLGEAESPRWVCHGCCKRMMSALESIAYYPVHSEYVGSLMAVQEIARELLSPNEKLSD